MVSEKHYVTGGEFPPLKEGTLRIYSMRFCPFAERTRLVLAHKNIPHELVNCNLKRKPEWLFEKNPFGLVPVLEKDDKVIYESGICNDYLEEVYPQNKLTPDEPYKKAQLKMQLERAGKVQMLYFGIIAAATQEDRDTVVKNILAHLDVFEQNLTGTFFGGDNLNMLDIYLWPVLEKAGHLQENYASNILPQDRLPKLSAYSKKVSETPAVKNGGVPMEYYHAFEKTHWQYKSSADPEPPYDIGL